MSLKEEWREIPGWEGYYAVSNLGCVKSLDRTVRRGKNGSMRIKSRILKPCDSGNGYLQVNLSRQGVKPKPYKINWLVLEAFVGPRPSGMGSLHFDDDPTNNKLSNLRWGTQVENVNDAIRNGLHHEVNKQNCKRGHSLQSPNLAQFGLRQGVRVCLACRRTQGRVQAKPAMKPHFDAIANDYYRAIMKETNVPS